MLFSPFGILSGQGSGNICHWKFFAIRKASPSQLRIHHSAQLLEMPGSSEKNFLDPVFRPVEGGFTVYGSLAVAANLTNCK